MTHSSDKHDDKQTALLIIDLQRWFLEVGSEEKIRAVSKLKAKTNDLIHFFEQEQLPVIKIQTVHKADKSTWNQWAIENDTGRLLEGTEEAAYSPEVVKAKHELILTKTRLSAFIRTDIEARLNDLNCNRVVICGYSTDNCVVETAMDAGFLVATAIRGRSLQQANSGESDQIPIFSILQNQMPICTMLTVETMSSASLYKPII